MEFPSLGKQCSFEDCGQLDFLPFLCNSCGKKYCLDHRYPTSHQCVRWRENEKNVQLCETCQSMVLKPKGISEKQILDEHLHSSCTLHLLSSISTTKQECFIKDCNNTSKGNIMVHVVCDGCGEMFCLKHRHPPAHQCASLNLASNEKMKRRKGAEEFLSKYRSISGTTESSSSKGVTNKPKKKNKKIEVMKLKSKAQGDSSVPMNSRLYLSVDFPLDSNVPNKPMFFNKEWVIGKVLDKIATVGKINNNNNKLSTDDSNRLVLINKETGNILEMNKKLGEVVESGDDISLEKYDKLERNG